MSTYKNQKIKITIDLQGPVDDGLNKLATARRKAVDEVTAVVQAAGYKIIGIEETCGLAADARNVPGANVVKRS